MRERKHLYNLLAFCLVLLFLFAIVFASIRQSNHTLIRQQQLTKTASQQLKANSASATPAPSVSAPQDFSTPSH